MAASESLPRDAALRTAQVPGAAAPAPARRKPLPLAYWLHSLFGLKVSLFLAFVCLTGTIATVSHEIEWLYKPTIRASSHTPGQEDWGALWGAAQAAYPGATVTGIGSYDRTGDTPYFAKAVSAQDAAGEDFTIYVDPGTGEVTGHEYGRSLQDAMRALHYYLFVPRDVGFYLVASLAFVLLGSLITGFFVYKKFWRGFFVRPRLGRNLRTAMGDLHRLGGLWTCWFAAVIGLTSVYYFFEWDLIDWNTPTPVIATSEHIATASPEQIAQWVTTARELKPGFMITAIAMPYAPGDPVIVQGHWRAALVRERADAVFLDPATGAMLGQRTAHEMAVTERIVHTVDPLHFGTFGGLATKLLWALCGLGLTFLAGSGAYIYAKRVKLAVREGINLSMLDYLGRWKWPSLIAITVVPLVAFAFW